MIYPEDFFGTSPPPRIIGAECEYDVQSEKGVKKSEYISSHALGAMGIAHTQPEGASKAYYFLSNGAKVYEDVDHVEYATPESLGPRQAAAADRAGAIVVARMVEKSGYPHRGVYRNAGSFMKSENYFHETITNEVTRGYHENYLMPRDIADERLLDQALPAYLASRIWAMSGTLRDEFTISQKAWGIGGDPIERRRDRLTQNGQKPMCIIPPGRSDGDITSDHEWARLEVRFADPCQSPTARFLSFAATSLLLRMVEHDHIVGKDLSKLSLKDPVRAAYVFSDDLSLRRTAEMEDGTHMSALDIQEAMAELALQLSEEIDLPEDEQEAVTLWMEICDRLRQTSPDEVDYEDTIRELEFAARHYYLTKKNEEETLRYGTQSAYRNLSWDRILPEGISQKWWQRFPSTYIDHGDVEALLTSPPPKTRARWRAECIADPEIAIDEVSWTRIKHEGAGSDKQHYRSNPYHWR